MTEVDISPLAKRLAEENNVDWRSLNGSGDEGRIVERDVLDFLARVMAGDEAADPTPEPLPAGLEAWPDGPPSTNGEESWSQPALVDDENGWSDTTAAGEDDAGSQAAAPADSSDSWDDGDDDLLEVETADAPVAASNSADEWAPGEWGDDDWSAIGGNAGAGERAPEDADLFAGIGDLGTDDRSTGGEQDAIDLGAENAGQTFDFGMETKGDAFDGGNPSAAGPTFDFDGAPQGEDDSVFDTSSLEPAIDEGIFVFDDEEEAVPAAQADTYGVQADEEQFETGAEEPLAAAAESSLPAESDTEHTPWEGGGASAIEVEEELEAPDQVGESQWEADSQASNLPASDAPWTAVAEENTFTGTVSESTEEAGRPPRAVGSDEYAFLDRADDSLPDGVRIEEDEHRVRSVVDSAPVSAGPATPSEPEAQRPATAAAASSGIVLRRDVDLTALVEARKALAAELDGQGSLSAFLLRAAVRAGQPWPLKSEGDRVGLATLSDDGIGISVTERAGEMSFRELIRACVDSVQSDSQPALAVADVSEMGIDEAVLDLGVPVLTVGRVLEADSGRFHATLTLSGLSAPDSGSKFLGRVAELLAAPVRLVL